MEPNRCNFIVQRKKRLCRMTVKPGCFYCGEHDPNKSNDNLQEIGDSRIPCPLDPKHTCYTSKLEKHLKICNARITSLPSYVRRGCNGVEGTVTDCTDEKVTLKDAPLSDLRSVIRIVETLYDKYIKDTIIKCMEHEIHSTVCEDYNALDRGDNTRKHLLQNSNLINILEKQSLIRKPGVCCVELGAGKGHLSYYLSKALTGTPMSSVLLVDRASHRHKQDNKLDKSINTVHRIRVDINDLMLSEVDIVRCCHTVVAVSKHLCGVATDFALNCITNDGVLDKVGGLLMATCCHHRCQYHSYVGKEFLQENHISKEQFNIMCGLVSWATCGSGFSRTRRKQISERNEAVKKMKLNNEREMNSFTEKHNSVIMSQNVEIDSTAIDEINHSGTIDSTPQEMELHIQDVIENDKMNSLSIESDIVNVGNDISQMEKMNSSVSLNQSMESSNRNKELGLSLDSRAEIGRKAKNILDYGRILFLNKFGFKTNLYYYVDVNVSPENVCLFAVK